MEGAQSRDFTIYRDLTPHAGGVANRLHVRLQDGTLLLFLLARRDEALAEMQGLIARHTAADPGE